ncbi:MAG: hypothetical protein LBI89_01530 [Prevotellaceae bacterium]|jgi:hypothetical protein|nr:hypothetical protein [Prevotellaceae bacterium]
MAYAGTLITSPHQLITASPQASLSVGEAARCFGEECLSLKKVDSQKELMMHLETKKQKGRFKYQMHKLNKHFTEEVDGFIKMDTLSRSPV